MYVVKGGDGNEGVGGELKGTKADVVVIVDIRDGVKTE